MSRRDACVRTRANVCTREGNLRIAIGDAPPSHGGVRESVGGSACIDSADFRSLFESSSTSNEILPEILAEPVNGVINMLTVTYPQGLTDDRIIDESISFETRVSFISFHRPSVDRISDPSKAINYLLIHFFSEIILLSLIRCIKHYRKRK